MQPRNTITLGVILIIVGVLIWLYGDYGYDTRFVLPGVIAIVLGVCVWLAGDSSAGSFECKKE